MNADYELKLHKSASCKKCKALRRELNDLELKMRRLSGGLIATHKNVTMSRLKERQRNAQEKLQNHMDDEFDKMPIWDQHYAVKLNPSLATQTYKLRVEYPDDWKKYKF